MGNFLSEVIVILKQARDLLLRESQQAGSLGDWPTAKTLMELAERADRLREEVPISRTEGEPRKKDGPNPIFGDDGDRATPQSSREESYPKYLVRDDILIKQGLQRTGRDVYEHAVPREQYDQIIDSLKEIALTTSHGKQRPFNIERVQTRLKCPRYMTYVVVSMLLREGLLLRSRKGIYTFATPTTFGTDAATLWDRLKGDTIS
jgi:hypothetical protein